jgi:hypothetical protein
MNHKDYQLTNQHLNDAFLSHFTLLARAFKLAKDAIRSGRSIHPENGVLNEAQQVLAKIGREIEQAKSVE